MTSKHRNQSNTPFEEAVDEYCSEETVGHGDHIGIFYDDPTDLFNQLPEIIQDSQMALSYADNKYAKPYAFPEQEPTGALLVWPIPRFGLISVIQLNSPEGGNEFISAYPWVSEGTQHTVVIEEIKLWPNRLEAQIQGLVGPEKDHPIVFFDPLFAANRIFYKTGEPYQFIFAGFPYTFEIVSPDPIVIDEQEHVSRLRGLMHADDPSKRDSKEPLIFQTQGMTALIPREDLAKDDYEFQGPVKSVTELHETMLDQRVWRIRVTVLRPSDADFDIDLYVPENKLADGCVPSVGDDVRGILWLQAYLWLPGES
ncbi:MAG: hypothetical protein HUN04_15700 [Desulfobacter sp.]|nr:MAG: hypothetical protein HUN04_15700 [Desulfobacter sp.]